MIKITITYKDQEYSLNVNEQDTPRSFYIQVSKLLNDGSLLRILNPDGTILARDDDTTTINSINTLAPFKVISLTEGSNLINLSIKIMNKTVPLSIHSEASVFDLCSLIQIKEGIPIAHHQLMFMNNILPSTDSTTPLSFYRIGEGSTLDAIIARNRCWMAGCTEKSARIIGDCKYCGGAFCSKHRLPESHSCMELNSCRQRSFEKNQNKLMGEKCVADKV